MGFIDTLTTKGPIEDSRIDYFPDAVPRDCVLYLPLARNRLRGDTFRSLDSYRHPCTVTGAVWTPQGRSFDGVDDLILITNPPALRPAKITAATWVKPSEIGRWNHVLNMTADINNVDGYRLTITDVNLFRWRIRGADAVSYTCISTEAAEVGKWYFFLATYDEADMKIYVDAALLKTEAVNQPILYNTANFNVSFEHNLMQGIKGSVGPVYVFNRALTPQEIQRIYLATKDRYQ